MKIKFDKSNIYREIIPKETACKVFFGIIILTIVALILNYFGIKI